MQNISPEINISHFFRSEKARASIDRAVAALRRIYVAIGNVAPERLWQAEAAVEEYFVFMPTKAAYFAEKGLVSALNAHADGKLDDDGVKSQLREYMDTHIFVYSGAKRTLRKGTWGEWTGNAVKLVLLEDARGRSLAPPCNEIQAHLWQEITGITPAKVREI